MSRKVVTRKHVIIHHPEVLSFVSLTLNHQNFQGTKTITDNGNIKTCSSISAVFEALSNMLAYANRATDLSAPYPGTADGIACA